MTIGKASPLLLLLFLTTALQAYCEDHYSITSPTSEASSLQKIYIAPSRLFIIPEGIFFLNQDGYLEATCGVFHDQNGIYVFAKQYYRCPACYRWNDTNVCYNKNCSLFGK